MNYDDCNRPFPIQGCELADFLEFDADWSVTNRERGRLIDKSIAGTISPKEQARLDSLQAYADYYLNKVAPRPTYVLDGLRDLVQKK